MPENNEVYRDNRYILYMEDGLPYLKTSSEKYRLTCHPYEPCLYITDQNGHLTAVHNSFDPYNVMELFRAGQTITSITGFEYHAKDFCRMVEYAAGAGDIGIDDAEKVFNERIKKMFFANIDKPDDKETGGESIFTVPDGVSVIKEDPFYEIAEKYPDSVIDYCLVKNDVPYNGIDSHWAALLCAALKIFSNDEPFHIHAHSIHAKQIRVDALFAPAEKNGILNYRKAFLDPPYTNNYTDEDFEKLNEVLFPHGRHHLDIFDWTTDWSDYFDDGREWWGTLCITVYDKSLNRFVVMMASATD